MNYSYNQLSKFNLFCLNIKNQNIVFLQGNLDNVIDLYKKGHKIHIKKENKGKFTDYCGGKVTDSCILRGKNSSDPKIRKRATFAANARTWKKQNGGTLDGTKLF